MKKYIFIITVLFLIACSSDDDNQKITEEPNLVGNWNLVAMYTDPGDGSGNFVSIESDKIIEFDANGTLSSNADLCQTFSEPGDPSSGTYSATESTISITDCEFIPFSTSFEIIESYLIISYPCIEACQERYVKME